MRVKLELSMFDLPYWSQNPQQGGLLAAAGKAKALGRGRDLSCMIRILCKPREFVLGINGSRAVEAKENKVLLQSTTSQNAFTVFIIKTNMVHNLSTPFAWVDIWPFILFLSETYNLFREFYFLYTLSGYTGCSKGDWPPSFYLIKVLRRNKGLGKENCPAGLKFHW